MLTNVIRRGKTTPSRFVRKNLISAFALAVTALSLSATAAETGRAGDVASWETDEYKADWGLDSMKASYAYAQGITGKNVKVGVIDSGAALHPELEGERWHRLSVKGEYENDGERYPKGNGPDKENPNGSFKDGESFNVSADYEHGISDSHGTHVAGTVGANRDGVGMHGVAFNAEMYLASTGGNDNMVYGENQDYAYFKAAYQAMADQGVKIVNQSWGSATSDDFGKSDYWNSLAAFEAKGRTFVDAAAEVALENDMIFVWTNGNNSNINPYLRASMPYFRPELEKNWLTVAAGNESDLEGFSGKAGIARWWTVTAPGKDINSSFVNYPADGAVKDEDGNPLYKKYSGTSQAAPHATGALALVMERFDYMTATQARDVLLTTATATPGGDSFKKTPDDKIGWGYVNLKEAMRGPRQILGTLDVTMNDRDDVWTHDIVEDAWNGGRFVMPRSMKEQDKIDKRDWDRRKPQLEAKIADKSITAAEKAEYDAELRRETIRNERMEAGYAGKLVKRGNGTLTLTGENAFSGGLTVHEGTVAGLTNAFGTAKVTVEDGGNLAVLNQVKWEEVTENGWESREKTYEGSKTVSVNVLDGGTLTLQNKVNLGTLGFEGNGYVVTQLTADERTDLRTGEALDWSFTMKGEWNPDTFVDTGLAFYEVKDVAAEVQDGKSLVSVHFGLADTRDFSTVAAMAAAGNKAMENWSRTTALRTEETLRNDVFAASQNVSLLHAHRLMNAAFDKSADRREATLNPGLRIWAEALGVKGETTTVEGDADTALTVGFFGVEREWTPGFQTGAYFAVGEEETEIGDSKVKGDVYHVGLYLDRDWQKVGLRAALSYTGIERDVSRFMGLVNATGYVTTESDLTVWQSAAEIRYRLLEGDRFAFVPKATVGVMMFEDDGTREMLDGHLLTRTPDDRTVGFVKIGFEATHELSDAVSFAASLGYNRYFGDTSAEVAQSIDRGSAVKTEMLELEDAAEVGLEARWQPTATLRFGLAYDGLFSDDTTEHGLRAKVTYLF